MTLLLQILAGHLPRTLQEVKVVQILGNGATNGEGLEETPKESYDLRYDEEVRPVMRGTIMLLRDGE